MNTFYDLMSDRFMILVVNIINIEKQLFKTYSCRHVYSQLFRAGTSVGANYEEARAGESRADFIHKMQIVVKELRECNYWVKVIINAKMISPNDEAIRFLFNESKELLNISAKSVVTAKSKTK
ncbi:MAG: four helix bundle protein [Bacteroidetes bacterium]|nr:four helix bundle protein [Bacteroidota bacterium]